MANKSKTFILAPTLNTPPDGPVVLGNIIAVPNHPEETENQEPPAAFEGPNQRYESHKKGWTENKEKHSNIAGGFFAEFLQMLSLGSSNVEFGHSISKSGDLTVRAMDTYWFNPNKAYIDNSVRDPGVKSYLGSHRFHVPPVYMITGLMIARGAAATKKVLRDNNLHAQIGIDLTSVGAPITAGPTVGVGGGKGSTTAFDESSDFVLAYRLKKIKVKNDGTVKSEDYTKGALYADTFQLDDAGNMVVDPPTTSEPDLEVDDDEDVTAAGLDVDPKVFDEDGDSWECVVLPP